MTKGRLEAFSDGVMAVAITLLVLDLHVDVRSEESLAHQIRHEWPSFAAYVVSFFVIGVIWINHHAILSLAARVDRLLMAANLLLLLFVTALPFATSTLAAYLGHGSDGDQRLAVLLYGAATEGMAISFTFLFASIASRGLAHHPVPRDAARRAIVRFGAGSVVYPLVTLVGLLSAPVMLLLYALLTAYYVFDQTPPLPSAAQEG